VYFLLHSLTDSFLEYKQTITFFVAAHNKFFAPLKQAVA
jgi:hypothetical protein